MVDVADLDPGVLHGLLEGVLAAVDQIGGHPLELRAGQGDVQVQRALGRGGDVGQVDACLGGLRQFDLGLLGGFPQALQGHFVLAEVDAVLTGEGLDQVVGDALVPVVATEVGVTGGRLHLDNAVADLQQGHVEGAATEVEDQNGLFLLALVQAVGKGGRGGLVHDAQDVQTGDGARLGRRLTLGVVEVGGHGDDRVGHGLTEVGLGIPLELLEDEGADLLRSEVLGVDLHLPVGAHVALDRPDGPFDVRDRLPFRDFANQDLAVLGEGDDGRGRPGALGIGDHRGLAALEHAHDGVRGAEVDTDRSCHVCVPLRSGRPGCSVLSGTRPGPLG